MILHCHVLYTESEAVTAVWNSLLELPNFPLDLCNGIWIMGSTEMDDDDDLDGPGRSCWSGELAEIIMLYVIRATEKVTSIVKKKFPQLIFVSL